MNPRLLARLIYMPDGCLVFSGAKDRGYGKWNDGQRNFRVHRYVYELVRGAVPAGLVLDHLCRNRGCANPLHLEAVPQRVNLQRALSTPPANRHCSRCDGLTEHRVQSWQQAGRSRYRALCNTCDTSHTLLATTSPGLGGDDA